MGVAKRLSGFSTKSVRAFYIVSMDLIWNQSLIVVNKQYCLFVKTQLKTTPSLATGIYSLYNVIPVNF